MVKMNIRLLLWLMSVVLLMSCECPLSDEEKRGRDVASNGDQFYADMLIGTWQCDYQMVIAGYEFKQIVFLSNGKADITMAKEHDTDWFTETYSYAYYGSTLRFSKGRNNISLNIEGYLFPELYVRDSFGCYTLTKRK
jgi:hypothetical protein